jgi:SsrA-binding protein
MKSNIDIKNKRASFDYELNEHFTAGIMLTGTEIKSIREGKASFTDSFAFFKDDGLWLKGLHISEYTYGTINNHEPKRERKLLLTKKELRKISTKVREKGFTIVPVRLFINENSYAKVEIALARGKATFDKRETLKSKDAKREMDRMMKK